MAHTYTSLMAHIIFSTKDRAPVLASAWRPKLFAYMGGIIKKHDAMPILINGVDDHVHVFANVPASLALAELVQHIKGGSSYWVNRQPEFKTKLAWQVGYGAFSVSASKVDAVKTYIANQEQHHRKLTFKEELIRFLDEYGVEYEEKHLWD
jgi:REP element-mobilizing transposase RayT